jgi:hypothetical protein
MGQGLNDRIKGDKREFLLTTKAQPAPFDKLRASSERTRTGKAVKKNNNIVIPAKAGTIVNSKLVLAKAGIVNCWDPFKKDVSLPFFLARQRASIYRST